MIKDIIDMLWDSGSTVTGVPLEGYNPPPTYSKLEHELRKLCDGMLFKDARNFIKNNTGMTDKEVGLLKGEKLRTKFLTVAVQVAVRGN